MRRVRRFLGGLVAASVLSLPAPAAAADAACSTALPLVWLPGGLAPPAVLDEAEREASRIWEAAGIDFLWARSAPGRAIRPGELLLMVRDQLALAPGLARRRSPLGRLIRVSGDRPGRLIELAFPDIAASVLKQSLHGRTVGDLPEVARHRVVGRALGRVVAHEIGHWLFGGGHTREGLMRAAIRRHDLIAPDAPSLPADWPSGAGDRLRAHRPCQMPSPILLPGAPS
jgi:hypothetical protein